jgi:hypothetical protein
MSERILMKFIVGQRVVKEGEDSRFEGEVVAAVKRDLKTLRYVVENDDGVLHIANERQLRLAIPKAPARLEPSHSGDVTARAAPSVHAPVSADHLPKGGDQLAPPGASNSNLNIAKLYLPHQHMPAGRLPGFHQSHSRPLVSLLVKPQAHEIERRWRRPAFDCGGPERRASP